ncbi:alpha/beta fold hydrolase [Ruegeria sp. HKCCD5849]|nr:alpha/beta fold hydrolase [Ruegeria sp. HKCCD5849]NOD51192.1 alpha/beta fold hydrolase [Ruegeria sp. HKCCD5851]NOD68011.1 alpha/beta fold hydrolase [Ruegeria sp. HKCCD7303]
MEHSEYATPGKVPRTGLMTSRWKIAGIVSIVLITTLYAAVVGYMYLNQRALLFKPSGVLPEPASVGLVDIDVMTKSMEDGTELTVWAAPAATQGAPTVLFFHGQSGNLGDRADRLREILNSGYGLLAPSYRGYPGSTGTPSQATLVSDGLELFDQLYDAGEAVVLHGQSLGTAVAAQVAAQRPEATMLVLEAPFTATVDVAAERYPWLPVSALMHDQFATRDIIGTIEVPTLIFHGTGDQTVPVHHGARLAKMGGERVEFFLIPGGTHNELWSYGLWQTVQDRLPQY